MKSPMLFILAGLPASGKTTLSRMLAADLKAVHLRIDTIEQGLRDLFNVDVEGEGYGLAYRIAADNLQLGLSVVADSCNPIDLTRQEWQRVALAEHADFVNIEVICSDPVEHRHRVESRACSIPNLVYPTWSSVLAREYDSWDVSRLVVDTAAKSPETAYDELRNLLVKR